ncbi:protein phosphatase 1 regulatory subunit 3F-like, partial [Gracilinanus agilis]|uniref:protein phosphatase 1 regulatory subunit 3F-like n=1 Tax=Gracilinanus agilis TaxID=191870 RepID=UPI001CFD97BD
CSDDGDRESGSPLVSPLPLQPGPQITQISDGIVANSSENKGSHPDLPETPLECPQSPAIEIHPPALSSVPDQGGALGGPPPGAEEEDEEALLALARPLGEQPSDGQPGKALDPFGSDEAQSEDAVDLELEQLYLTHLSRLRAAGAADGLSGGILFTDHDQDLLKWMGPERALNSSLVEEITLHYAMQGVHGATDLPEDAKEGGGGGKIEELGTSCEAGSESESGSGSESELESSSGEGDILKESPPGIVTGTWLAGQHPGFILVKDGLSQSPEEQKEQKEPEDPDQEHGPVSVTKAEGLSFCLQEGSSLLPSSTAQGGGQLQRALSQSLCVLGLLVFLPIAWNACMAFVGLAFYLSLAWFS